MVDVIKKNQYQIVDIVDREIANAVDQRNEAEDKANILLALSYSNWMMSLSSW